MRFHSLGNGRGGLLAATPGILVNAPWNRSQARVSGLQVTMLEASGTTVFGGLRQLDGRSYRDPKSLENAAKKDSAKASCETSLGTGLSGR
jgi:hypothetical protein